MPVGTVAFAEKGSETFNCPLNFFELSDENEVAKLFGLQGFDALACNS
jgi:hypothetical protein